MSADRMRIGLALLLAAIAAGNGLFMVVDPLTWYATVPGVPQTGPANTHFLLDVGFAYLTSALLLIGAVAVPRQRGGLAVAAAIWPALHAGFHVAGDLSGGDLRFLATQQFLVTEMFGIYAPAAAQLALGVYWWRTQ